ncbi:MAG: tetratricopeptide repeat protein [Spirochaetota bacterium]
MKSNLFSISIFILALFVSISVYAESEFFRIGLSHYTRGEFEIAAAHFEEAKNAEPRNQLVYFYLGNSYYQLNELDKAILNYTTGLDFTQDKGKFFYNLGNCYYLKGNYSFATEMYSKAVLHTPNLFDAYLNAGNAYYRAGNYQKTIFNWETYLEKYPQTPQYENIQRAIAYLKEELIRPQEPSKNIDENTGLDIDLLTEILGDLDRFVNQTTNILETSEAPIDDLTTQDIER